MHFTANMRPKSVSPSPHSIKLTASKYISVLVAVDVINILVSSDQGVFLRRNQHALRVEPEAWAQQVSSQFL